MKKSIKKGFTLVELIVVMAIFSILMVGVMSLITPVSNMFKSSAISEKTYSYANNVQQYLQTKLEYAEAVYVGSSDKMGLTSDGKDNNEKIAKIVEKFRTDHFENTVVTPDGGTTIKYVNGKIHVIRLVNSDGTLSNGDEVKKGQITHRIYDFNSEKDAKIDTTLVVDEVPELNPAYISARDAAYDFNYSLGATKAVITTPKDKSGKEIKNGETYKALDKDISNKQLEINSANLTLSIMLNKKAGGFIDCDATKDSVDYTYRAFATPCALQLANLPLTNIANRTKRGSIKHGGILRPKKGDTGIVLQSDAEAGLPFEMSALSDVVDFDNDIYFVFCYTDELDS